MKRAMVCVAGMGLFLVVLSFGYYGSYQMSLERLGQKSNRNESLQEMADNDSLNEDFTAELIETNHAKIDRITENTRCILEIYDIQSQLLEKKETAIQKEFYGFSREEVLMYLEAFVEEMPDAEKEKGMVSYELLSFSENEMVLRKSYDPMQVEYAYFMKAEGEEIVVFFSDKNRIYEYTGILTGNLPKEDREKLKAGFYVKDKAELYGILENYSS